MEPGERQVAPTREGVREDHLARYRFAAEKLKGKKVVDAGCGVGYGSLILAEAGCTVLAIDNCAEALAYAMEHYAHDNITYIESDIAKYKGTPTYDAVVCFEVLEHLKAPGMALANFVTMAPELLTSVPNEAVLPFEGPGFRTKYHERHYTAEQLEDLLNGSSWEVRSWHGQAGKQSDVEPLVNGRTLVVVAKYWTGRDGTGKFLSGGIAGGTHKQLPPPPAGPPARVAIVAMGASKSSYAEFAVKNGGRHLEWDEVWAVNSMGGVIQHDRLFHMDDVLLQESRTATNNEIKGLLHWLEQHPGPIYTSTTARDVLEKADELREVLSGELPTIDDATPDEVRADIEARIDYLEEMAPRYARYPGLVPFPLKEVLEEVGAVYLNNTVSYAIALAISIGVKQISLFGVDFTYPDAHISEKGRACCEFLLGLAAARGVNVQVPTTSTLMDANEHIHFYGYDAWELKIMAQGGRVTISKTPKPLPTVEEIEERYRKVPKELAA